MTSLLLVPPAHGEQVVTEADVRTDIGGDGLGRARLGVEALSPPVLSVGRPPLGRLQLARWAEPLITAAARSLALPENWDSYGAKQVRLGLVEATIKFVLIVASAYPKLPAPSLVPTPDGGVQIEWHTRDIDLEIESIGAWRFIVVAVDRLLGEEWDAEVGADLRQLFAWLTRLNNRVAASPAG